MSKDKDWWVLLPPVARREQADFYKNCQYLEFKERYLETRCMNRSNKTFGTPGGGRCEKKSCPIRMTKKEVDQHYKEREEEKKKGKFHVVPITIQEHEGLCLRVLMADAELKDGRKFSVSHSGGALVIDTPKPMFHYSISLREFFEQGIRLFDEMEKDLRLIDEKEVVKDAVKESVIKPFPDGKEPSKKLKNI